MKREPYWKEIRRLVAERAALIGRRKIVTPKRASGAHPKLPEGWHLSKENAALPHRCFECGEDQLGEAKLHGKPGRCGKCHLHSQGSAMEPVRPYGNEVPPEAA